MSWTETAYLHSPVWLQQQMVAAYGWLWYRRRFSAAFHEQVSGFVAREGWGADAFRRYQDTQLDKLLEAAWRSPYYSEVFRSVGLNSRCTGREALALIPPLSKETLRTRSRDLLTASAPRGTTVFKSSGSTGTPTEIFYTRGFHALEMAVTEARNFRWAGTSYRDRRVMFGVRKVCPFDQECPPFWRFSPAENMAYASIYHLSPKSLPHYAAFLRSFQPAVITGYPSALHTLARYVLEHHDPVPPARALFTTSETVTDLARDALQEAWQCRVYDRYGAVEGCVFASQCEFGRYHVSPEIGIVEILDRNGVAAAPGVLGDVVCTGLNNLLQPLIRYQIGDVARWATEQACGCGRNLPVLERIEGRYEDMCCTPDGRMVLRFDTVFKGVDSIRQAQVIQESPVCFTLLVVPADGFSADDRRRLLQNMRLHVGDVETRIRTVAEIERGKSGKMRAVICRLSAQEKELLQGRSSATPAGVSVVNA